jgi:hypothetical protein
MHVLTTECMDITHTTHQHMHQMRGGDKIGALYTVGRMCVCAAHVVKYFASMGTSFTLSSHDLHGLTCEAGVETEWRVK